MSILTAAVGSSAVHTGDISHSLRFRATNSAYLSRTFGTPTAPSRGCFSLWVKRGQLGSQQVLFGAGGGTASEFGFDSSDRLYIQHNGVVQATSTAVFRDPSAHLHIFGRFNGSSLTEVYVNNRLVVNWANSPNLLNTAVLHSIGARATPNNFSDCYISRFCFVDGGEALTPSWFAYHNTESNAWVTKSQAEVKVVVDAGGANSCMLDFDDGTSLTTLGYDKSSKGNNWTLNNFSLTAGPTYDWMLDTPSNNFCTLNPLNARGYSYGQDANLRHRIGGYVLASPMWPTQPANIDCYVEITLSTLAAASYGYLVGLGVDNNSSPTTYRALYGNAAGWQKQSGNPSAVTSLPGVPAQGNVIMLAFKRSTNSLWIGVNGNWFEGNPNTGTNPSYSDVPENVSLFSWIYLNDGNLIADVNFGQRPFAYPPPVGFKTLCTANLPEVTGAALTPKKHFDARLRVGTGTTTAQTGIGFPPDLLWIKARGLVTNHRLFDKQRGTNALYSNATSAETNESAYFTSLDADGYTVTGGDGVTNGNGNTYVDWLWKAGGTPVTNNAGSIPSQVSANVEAGFSIVTYTGNATVGATVGHGLNAVPKMIIVKNRDVAIAGGAWPVYHAGMPSTYTLYLDQTLAGSSYQNRYDPAGFNINVFKTGSSGGAGSELNRSGEKHVAYCFAEIPGYSKIGSYTGNGSADGPFVYCGFRPRWLLVKRVDSTGNWSIHDTQRNPWNAADLALYPNLSAAEDSGVSGRPFDIVACGFKARSTEVDINANGSTYIFMAIAETNFKYANAR